MKKIPFSGLLIYILLAIMGCTKSETPIDPIAPEKTLSEIVSGNYSGNGKYMPHLKSLGPNTYDCSVPDWASYLKTGSASANVSSINDSTINIALSGSIYLTGFNKDLKLIKNGNQIYDPAGILKFFIDTKSLQVAYSMPIIVFGPGCNSVNSYYYVVEGAISVPPTPRYSYTSIGAWEFNGTK